MTIDCVAVTDDVMMSKPPVKLFAGTVTLGGTLATAGSLLDSATTAPPSGAPTLNTIVPNEPFPPTTVAGLRSSVESVAGGGACCGVKLRTADHAPAVPAVFTPRTRQKCVTVESPVVAYVEPETDCSRTSGALNALVSSIWIVYDAAPATSLQSKVIGCAGVSALAGASSVGAAGTGGGAGGGEPAALSRSFVTNASPQKSDGSPLNTVSKAPAVAGKSIE